jgi:hypothetical protein
MWSRLWLRKRDSSAAGTAKSARWRWGRKHSMSAVLVMLHCIQENVSPATIPKKVHVLTLHVTTHFKFQQNLIGNTSYTSFSTCKCFSIQWAEITQEQVGCL